MKSRLSKEVEYYSDTLFPKEVKKILYALSNENRQAILRYLSLKNEGTFSEIARALSIKKNILSYHLRILLDSGLVRQELVVEGVKTRTFYSLTELGTHTIQVAPTLFIPIETIVSVKQRKKVFKDVVEPWITRDLDSIIDDIIKEFLRE